MPLSNDILIRVNNLTRRFARCEALAAVSFEAVRGEIIGLLGPNGSGKTTTLRILSGYLAPTCGEVEMAGMDITAHSLDVRKKIGYLPESVPLYPEMKVEEYLLFRGRIKGLKKTRLFSRLRDVVDQCGLGEVLHRTIGNLSRGFRQRTGLADCLIHEPEILLLDEPLVGLDAAQTHLIRELLLDLREGRTLLFSTHMLCEAERLSNRVLILNGGRTAALDAPDALLRAARRLQADIQAPLGDVKNALESLEGGREARLSEKDDGWTRLSLPADGAPLPAGLEEWAARRQWPLRNLAYDAPTFDELFLRLTTLPPKVRNPKRRKSP
ncbi:MAG: ABC transporter ATP-binding protein [Verrucomicrobiota bacterium]|jgi:ABC-2 type transport system ATP-binding protein|nr:ABC transporter ATP-binding protein [Verrucomicrobiota bacterium]